MIGNPYKAELIKDRLDTLELMKAMAWEYKRMEPGETRDGVEECIKELGVISKEYSVMIDKAGPMPEKWSAHYQVMQNFYARNK